ncbi:MAG: polyphosphate kinase 2 [Campylobacterota bacterium]|nr:polyphosphate kinase 2 [Campylobacterota bacterium]
MNLRTFSRTEYVGLYKSKTEHPLFGKKYVARFQLNRKRYLKVLGYEKADNLTDLDAYNLLVDYKKSISASTTPRAAISTNNSKQNNKKPTVDTNKNVINNEVNNEIKNEEINNLALDNLAKENYKLGKLLGDYKSIDETDFKDGIQKIYDANEMKPYQIELIKMQKYLEESKKKMIVLFEGRDASGKGGAIRRMTRYMNSRNYRVVALGKPTETQKGQWFFQKYIEHFPTSGEVILFDRSWYNRAMVEPVFGFCTQNQYQIFMEDVVGFEHDLVRQDIILIKLYFSVSKDMQMQRFESRRTNPLKQWKLSEVDLQAQDLWEEFSEKKYEMLKKTHSDSAPWHIVRSDNKHKARMEAIKIVLNSVNYPDKNSSLNFDKDTKYNISVQQELSRMRQKKDY